MSPGLREIAKTLDPEIAKKLDRLVPLGLQTAKAIPAPFDQAILGDRNNDPGRLAVMRCVEALEDQAAEWGRIEQLLIPVIRKP